MKLTIEVEWEPMTTMNENPDEPVAHAHREIKFAAEDLMNRVKMFQGQARITKLSVEAS